jgi:murein DD-endopeptidase MepM/ murein hydrolase activator NlpD
VAETCFVCGEPVDPSSRYVLVRRKRQQVHCSEPCLRANVRARLTARAATRRRWALTATFALALLAGAALWQTHRVSRSRSISDAWPEVPAWQIPAAPPAFGPPWPPTDAQWIALFDGASWTHPLPGPVRRLPTADPRVFGPEPPRNHPAFCRSPRHCGVDLGGELWGEHVYAVLDGIVDRVQGDGNDGRGGRAVRLVHFGGTVFTQYFHLAATPRGLVRGSHVKAGDLIGLLGDTGLDGERRHLCFGLSVHPSIDLPEVYWDPTPGWPARRCACPRTVLSRGSRPSERQAVRTRRARQTLDTARSEL